MLKPSILILIISLFVISSVIAGNVVGSFKIKEQATNYTKEPVIGLSFFTDNGVSSIIGYVTKQNDFAKDFALTFLRSLFNIFK